MPTLSNISRCFSTTVTSFYMAESLKVKLNEIISNNRVSFLRKRFIEKKAEDFEYFNQKYIDNTANAIFDYLTLICFGEARHCYGNCNYILTDQLPHGRFECYRFVTRYEPFSSLEIMKDLFSKGWGIGSSLGGKQWMYIATVASQYKKIPNTAFIDQAVNLYHNGGLCFDKGIIWHNANPNLIKFLTAKNGKYIWVEKGASIYISELYKHVNETFQNLKKMRYIRANLLFISKEYDHYEEIQWGKKRLRGIHPV